MISATRVIFLSYLCPPPRPPPTGPRPGSPGSFWVVGTVLVTRALTERQGEGGASKGLQRPPVRTRPSPWEAFRPARAGQVPGNRCTVHHRAHVHADQIRRGHVGPAALRGQAPRKAVDRVQWCACICCTRALHSQHLKESAVPNTCPTLRTHRMQCQWLLHCTAAPPKFRQGKIAPPSLKTKISQKSPPENFPPPVQDQDNTPYVSTPPSTNGRGMPQHWMVGAVGWGCEACRSTLQRPAFSRWVHTATHVSCCATVFCPFWRLLEKDVAPTNGLKHAAACRSGPNFSSGPLVLVRHATPHHTKSTPLL